LLAIDESEKHVLSVWAWQEEQLVVKSSVRLEIYLIFAVTSFIKYIATGLHFIICGIHQNAQPMVISVSR